MQQNAKLVGNIDAYVWGITYRDLLSESEYLLQRLCSRLTRHYGAI